MRIMIIARGYPTYKYKLNGIFEFDQAKALSKAGHEVIYAAIDMRSIRRWRRWGIEKKTIDGIKVYAINIPVGRLPKAVVQQIGIFGMKILFKRIVHEQGKPDVLHAHFADIGYMASKLKAKTNIPFVMTEHLSFLMKPTVDKRLFYIATQTYKSADVLITVSPALQDAIKNKFNKESIFIPNVLDTELFSYSKKKSDGNFRFISVGNLIPLKRMDLIIEAFVFAFSKNEKVKLTIFGEGPERARLEELINIHNLGDKVALMGMKSRNEIAGHLKESDCFILTSRSETFGVAYIEALASGVPVIATKCGGPECFVNESNGLLVPVDDVNSVMNAMERIYNDIEKYDREAISKEVRERFSPESIASSLISIYKDIIK